jgi:hypothetical protein
MNWQTLKMYFCDHEQYFLLALSVLICAGCIWAGARLARVHRANLIKALLAAVLSMAVSWAIRYALIAVLPMAGSVFGFLLGFLLALAIIKGVYNTSLVRAVVVWICFMLAQPVIAFFLGVSFFGDMSSIFWKELPF